MGEVFNEGEHNFISELVAVHKKILRNVEDQVLNHQ